MLDARRNGEDVAILRPRLVVVQSYDADPDPGAEDRSWQSSLQVATTVAAARCAGRCED